MVLMKHISVRKLFKYFTFDKYVTNHTLFFMRPTSSRHAKFPQFVITACARSPARQSSQNICGIIHKKKEAITYLRWERYRLSFLVVSNLDIFLNQKLAPSSTNL